MTPTYITVLIDPNKLMPEVHQTGMFVYKLHDRYHDQIRSGPQHLRDAQYADAPYPDAESVVLDRACAVLCDAGGGWSRQAARSLWNEIHRLRIENERITVGFYQKKYEELTEAVQLYEIRLDEREQLTDKLQSDLSEANTTLQTMTEQRNAARTELQALKDAGNWVPVGRASYSQVMTERDAAHAAHDCEVVRNGELQAELQNYVQANANQSNEIMRLKGLPYYDSHGDKVQARNFYDDDDRDPEDMELTLHDKYTQSILPECLRIAVQRLDASRIMGQTGEVAPNDFYVTVVTEARAIATAAMKARQE